MDINSLIANYLSKSGSYDSSEISDIAERIRNIADSLNYDGNDSVFIYGTDGASEEEFLSFFEEHCEDVDDSEQLAEDVSLLFNILNSDDSDSVLDSDELELFERKNGNVTEFSFWNKLLSVDEGNIESNLTSLLKASDETSSVDSTDETVETEEDTDVDETDESEDSDELDFSDTATAKSFVESFIDDTYNTPAKVIDFLLSNGIITEEQASQLESAYTTYSDEEQAQIDALMDLGMTYDEAVESLENTGKISGSSSLDEEIKETISDENAKIYADQLYDSMNGLGTDESSFNQIFDLDLSSEDWVKIISVYNEEHGSFVQDVDSDFSFLSGKSDKMNTIAKNLVAEAENGNEEAIELLCKEFYNGTAGKIGTADEFISAVFENASDEVLAKIAENYSTVNEGRSIITDIKGDFSFSTEDDYIERLNKAIANS